MDWAKTTARRDEEHLSFGIWWTYIRDLTVHFNGLVQEKRNSIANALELRLSCTNPSICFFQFPCLQGLCKKDVTPLLTHWSYVFFALTHRFVSSSSPACMWRRWPQGAPVCLAAGFVCYCSQTARTRGLAERTGFHDYRLDHILV